MQTIYNQGQLQQVLYRSPMKKNVSLLMVGILSVVALSACQQKTPEQQIAETKTANIQNVLKTTKLALNTCDTITAKDLSTLLKLPEDKLKPVVIPIREGVWTCTYGENAAASFTVTVWPTKEQAAKDMTEYRNTLEAIAKTVPEAKYPQGAYSDISGTGEEAIFSAVNDALNARENAISILVMTPKDKILKINLATDFFYKIR